MAARNVPLCFWLNTSTKPACSRHKGTANSSCACSASAEHMASVWAPTIANTSGRCARATAKAIMSTATMATAESCTSKRSAGRNQGSRPVIAPPAPEVSVHSMSQRRCALESTAGRMRSYRKQETPISANTSVT